VRILIADDHELVRRGVRSVLRTRPDIEICGEAIDGLDAVEQSRHLSPDLVVMDISMPRLNGLEATREIRSILPSVNVLILSQHNSPEMMRQALNAGARGYVVKTAISQDLLAGIDKLREDQLFFPSSVTGSANANVDMQEILQRSQAFEKALRESEERYRLTFEQAAVGIAHVSKEGHFIRVNQQICANSRSTKSPIPRMLRPVSATLTTSPQANSTSTPPKNACSAKTARQSGSIRPLALSAIPIGVSTILSA
jgi:DNA-binding NarL/FixJ family response regulator